MNITVDEAREMSDAQLGRKVRAYLEEKHAQEEELATWPEREPGRSTRTLIAIPCMDAVPVRFMTSLLAMRRMRGEVRLTMNSLIYDARNQLAKAAIEEGFDRVLWLDSDMVFEPDLMERLAARIDEGREFVSGLYFQRKPPYRPTIYREMEIADLPDGGKAAKAEPFRDYPEHDIFEVDAAGFGMVMTTTRLLRDVTEQCGMPFTPVPGFGEDMAFCLRARAIGYPLWCDSSIRGLHIGTTLFGEEDWMKSTEKEEKG